MKTSSFIAAAVFAMLPAVSQSAVVVNGSFEIAPDVLSQGVAGHGAGTSFENMPTSGSHWGIWTSGIAGWRTDANGIELQNGRPFDLTAADGDYYAELDTSANSRIMQDIFFEVGTYDLSFGYSPRTKNINSNDIEFGIGDILAGAVSGPEGEYTIGKFTTVTRRFEITEAGTHTLFFAGAGTSDSYGGFIDNVQLSAVPLPAGLLLLGTALAGFGIARRRRKS